MQLIDTADEDLNRKLDKEKWAQWRKEAHEEYAKSHADHVWEMIDGEDFN